MLVLAVEEKKIHIHMLRSNARCPVGKTILCNLVPFYLFFKNVFFVHMMLFTIVV